MFKCSPTTLRVMQDVWGFQPGSVEISKSPLGLYALMVEDAASFGRSPGDVKGMWGNSSSDPSAFLRSFLGDLPSEAFNCGIWMTSPGHFQAICPHRQPTITATLLISAFQLGVCSPLDIGYPGYMAAHRSLIEFFSQVSHTHGVLANTVWTRMNGAFPFRDPGVLMDKYTSGYFDDRDWA